MNYIDLNKPINYKTASLRFFKEDEIHVTRIAPANVLLLVFDGVLKFNEDGVDYEISKGEYFIQRNNGVQIGNMPSITPKYLYVHFDCEWKDNQNKGLFRHGKFNCEVFKPLFNRMSEVARGDYSLAEKQFVFLTILNELYNRSEKNKVAQDIKDYIQLNYKNEVTLKDISRFIHFSQNHIIKLFKTEFEITPFNYLNDLRLNEAEQLLKNTSETLESICFACGYKSYVHFYNLFIRKNKISPLKWRKINRE